MTSRAKPYEALRLPLVPSWYKATESERKAGQSSFHDDERPRGVGGLEDCARSATSQIQARESAQVTSRTTTQLTNRIMKTRTAAFLSNYLHAKRAGQE